MNNIETLYDRMLTVPISGHYVFDMRQVKFINPYGIIALLTTTRYLSAQSDKPVLLENLDPNVHSYLHRIDLFKIGHDWLRSVTSLDEEWERNPHTPNLLELTFMNGPEDVESVALRAETIFSRWLVTPNLGSLLNVLSELCANVYQHSGDQFGCIMIQKYESPLRRSVIILLAVGDMGRGIRGSLMSRYGDTGSEPLDYLREAMRGKSSRATGRGGLGLRRVEQIVASDGGYLWLRSESAAIHTSGPGLVQGFSNLAFVPGTQIAVELHAPLGA